jgi:hypothetical protein
VVCLFLLFFNVGSADVETLFAALLPPPEGRGEVSHQEILLAPSPSFLKVSFLMARQASSLFTLGNRKKSAKAISGKWGWCWNTQICLAAIQSVTMAAVCTGALSK